MSSPRSSWSSRSKSYPPPICATLFALVIATAAAISLAMLQAITNQHVALQGVEEMITVYLLPGKDVTNSIFKATAYTGTLAGDLKLGHHTKVPSRMMSTVQLVAAVITCVVVIGVLSFMFANIAGICMPDAPNHFVWVSCHCLPPSRVDYLFEKMPVH
ncbi:OPT oligopeptide transporter protein-domain-containing protein [Favolaschia claudopus]|uniref:OPT oligopeptide transporter protein-domain-containing protein n=1 Tax=Favolaschia claudopus TaxID=2862362 RepID=A0AAW0ABC4_9AGAR